MFEASLRTTDNIVLYISAVLCFMSTIFGNTCMIEYDTSTIKTQGEVKTLKRKLDAMASHTEKLRQDILSNMEAINKQVAHEKENIKEFSMHVLHIPCNRLEQRLQQTFQ
jgi:cell division protein FtsL